MNSGKVTNLIDDMRKQYATLENVNRPITDGDRVELTIEGDLKFENVVWRVAKNGYSPFINFYSELIGKVCGIYDVRLNVRKDYRVEELQEKRLFSKLIIHNIKGFVLPPLDDKLPKLLGFKFETLQAFENALEMNQLLGNKRK